MSVQRDHHNQTPILGWISVAVFQMGWSKWTKLWDLFQNQRVYIFWSNYDVNITWKSEGSWSNLLKHVYLSTKMYQLFLRILKARNIPLMFSMIQLPFCNTLCGCFSVKKGIEKWQSIVGLARTPTDSKDTRWHITPVYAMKHTQ